MYKALKMENIALADLSYSSIDDRGVLKLIQASRTGVAYSLFGKIVANSPFTLKEWSNFIHVSERTMQRYTKERKVFDPIQSEKILEVALVYKFGVSVFGVKENFDIWLNTINVAMGKIKPKSLLDTTFGIGLLKDELGRITHGVLA
ncbi:MAG: hypothetical protein COC08_01005 [Maribacter sp.]|nr:MAG: hypothetical protein COC08_01005 [Maribacter sp.]